MSGREVVGCEPALGAADGLLDRELPLVTGAPVPSPLVADVASLERSPSGTLAAVLGLLPPFDNPAVPPVGEWVMARVGIDIVELLFLPNEVLSRADGPRINELRLIVPVLLFKLSVSLPFEGLLAPEARPAPDLGPKDDAVPPATVEVWPGPACFPVGEPGALFRGARPGLPFTADPLLAFVPLTEADRVAATPVGFGRIGDPSCVVERTCWASRESSSSSRKGRQKYSACRIELA